MIRWFAQLPDTDGEDSFDQFEIALDGASITAWSWSCFQCTLDPRTGRIRQATFVK